MLLVPKKHPLSSRFYLFGLCQHPMSDLLKKYLFADRSIRIQSANLSQTWSDAREHQKHPKVIEKLLGELCAASVLLASNLKFDGSLVLQIQGDGPIALLVVECDSELRIRATVKLRQEYAIKETSTFQELVNPNHSGHFVVILDLKDRQEGQQAYQGIVSLQGNSVAEVLENYMRNSEQLDTYIRLAADDHKATGILLQRLPATGGIAVDKDKAEENWEKSGHFIQTITSEEQLELSEDELIHRLFWEEQLLKTEEDHAIQWYCSCSRERVADMLRMLGVAEIDSILEERNGVDVSCDYCGMPYHFDAIECAQLFIPKDKMSSEESSTEH